MLARLHTFSLLGIEALPVEVEVDVSAPGLPKTVLVGLPEAAVRESTHRVERALVNSGYERVQGRVVINLAPAELPKQAATFDLPITLGILMASGQVQLERATEYAIVGELALDGSTRPARGVLSMALATRAQGLRGLIVPEGNGSEAAVVEEIEVLEVGSLAQAIAFLQGELELEPVPSQVEELFARLGRYEVDFSDVRGQEMAKRALVLAAAGAHNVLMIGPPGSGKTMLAKRLPTILPPLSPEEALETTRIYSAVGLLDRGVPLVTVRPFRSPHHTISEAGLVGGGSHPSPGEISLAHNGVLFLDELPEFNRRTLEVLRQPLEDRQVTISRAHAATTFPANFMLVAAMNPCPCGWRNDPRRSCHCSATQVERYMSRISGPLLDRIDIHVEVPGVPYEELSSRAPGTPSAQMRKAVQEARAIQAQRFAGTRTRYNAQMTASEVRRFCQLEESASRLLRNAMNQLGLSARAHDKILRVARTIADLENSPHIQAPHLAEAINYRILDRQFWG